MCFKVHVVQPGMVILADALDPNKKGVGAAQGSCLGDYMAVAIERCNGATDFGATCFFSLCHTCFSHGFFLGVDTLKPEKNNGMAKHQVLHTIQLHLIGLTGQVQISFGLGLSLYCGIASLSGHLQYGTSNWNPSNFS